MHSYVYLCVHVCLFHKKIGVTFIQVLNEIILLEHDETNDPIFVVSWKALYNSFAIIIPCKSYFPPTKMLLQYITAEKVNIISSDGIPFSCST